MNRFNLYLTSITFDEEIIDDEEKLLVSVSTIPEEMKDSILINNISQMKDMKYSLPVTITPETKQAEFIFTKICPMENNPIIGSSVIYSNQFPTFKDNDKIQIFTFNIYEHGNTEKKIVGKINVKFILSTPYEPQQLQNIKVNHMTNNKTITENKTHNYNNTMVYADN